MDNNLAISQDLLSNKEMKKKVKRNMVLLLLGKLVSLFGSSIYTFATSLYILTVTGSGLSFSLTLVLGTLPQVIFGPISGVISDRFDRKKMVVLLDILSGLVVLGLYFVSQVSELRVGYIYITAFLLSTCSVFFRTPLSASLPNIVDDENLTRVNSLSQTIASLSSIAGPFIGGFVFAIIDIRLFFLLNGLSFVMSGISEIFIDFNLNNKENIKDSSEKKEFGNNEELDESVQSETKSFWEDFKEGISYIVTEKWLLVLSLFFVSLNMLIMMGLMVPIPYIVNEIWGFSSQQFGILNMMFPVGMLLGSLILALLPQAEKNYRRIIFCILTFSIAIIFVGLLCSEIFFVFENVQYLIMLTFLFIIIALAATFINVPMSVTMQRLVPANKLGRVSGTLSSLSVAMSPLGIIAGGVLVDLINPWILPVVCGLMMLFAGLAMTKVEDLKAI